MKHFSRGQVWVDGMIGELRVVQVRWKMREVVFRKLNGDLLYLSAEELRWRLGCGSMAQRKVREESNGSNFHE